MMQMLHSGGMEILSDNVRKADEDNPRGYYEFEKVKDIRSDSSWLKNAVGKAFKMVSMLLFNLPVGYRYKIIIMRRDMKEVLASQAVMLERLGNAKGQSDDRTMATLYSKHLLELDEWMERRKDIDVLRADFCNVIERPDEVSARIAKFLGGGLDREAMAGIVERDLYRQKSGR